MNEKEFLLNAKEKMGFYIEYCHKILSNNFKVDDYIIYLDVLYYTRYKKPRIVAYCFNDTSMHEMFNVDDNTVLKFDILNKEEFNNIDEYVILYLSTLLEVGVAKNQNTSSKLSKEFYIGMQPKNFIKTFLDSEKEIHQELLKCNPNEEQKIKGLMTAFVYRVETISCFLATEMNDENINEINSNFENLQNNLILEKINTEREDYNNFVFENVLKCVEGIISTHSAILYTLENTIERAIL